MKTRVPLPRTSWSLLIRVAKRGTEATSALDEFTNRYYDPIRGYIGAIVRNSVDSQDLTQLFFERAVLSGRLMARATSKKGSFRAYLKQSLRNFILDEWRRRRSRRAQAAVASVRPDMARGGWDRIVQEASPSAETAFHREWV